MSVAVIGAGIIGLSCAVEIQKQEPKCKVTLIADKFSPNTTSDIAAGFWHPVCARGQNEAEFERWGTETFALMRKLSNSQDAKKYGAGYVSGYELFDEFTELPSWANFVLNFRRVPKSELIDMGWSKFKDGYFFTTCYLEPTKFLACLTEEFRENGGVVLTRKLANLDDLDLICQNGFDVVVNASGLGAYNLLNDKECFPIRGQIYRVLAPFQKHFLRTPRNYVLLNNDQVILGGCYQNNDWRCEIDDADSCRIWKDCVKLVPSLKNCKILGQYVGLRPARMFVRLEVEDRTFARSGAEKPVIHCYGHGGSGITLFYGCAHQVATLCRDYLTEKWSKI